MTEEWLDFIAACRLGKSHNYDIVEGPMADDTIFNYVQNFVDGRISREAFWNLAKFKKPTHQISNVKSCRYEVPDYWAIGEVYERLIEDLKKNSGKEVIDCIKEVYGSWINDAISNYNTDFYYQSRDYIYECFKEGQICA